MRAHIYANDAASTAQGLTATGQGKTDGEPIPNIQISVGAQKQPFHADVDGRSQKALWMVGVALENMNFEGQPLARSGRDSQVLGDQCGQVTVLRGPFDYSVEKTGRQSDGVRVPRVNQDDGNGMTLAMRAKRLAGRGCAAILQLGSQQTQISPFSDAIDQFRQRGGSKHADVLPMQKALMKFAGRRRMECSDDGFHSRILSKPAWTYLGKSARSKTWWRKWGDKGRQGGTRGNDQQSPGSYEPLVDTYSFLMRSTSACAASQSACLLLSRTPCVVAPLKTT